MKTLVRAGISVSVVLGLALLPVRPAVPDAPVIAPPPLVVRNARDGAAMVLISGGPYRAENIHLKEPARKRLGAYYIYKDLVTVAQYRAFCAETGRRMPPQPEWKEREGLLKLFPERWFRGEELAPVTGVTWDDAEAYCRWAGVSLPTDAQWEKAAWGNGDWHSRPPSPYGLDDLFIPLRQWCAFNPEDARSSPVLAKPNRAALRSVRGTYGPFDPNPNEHSALARGSSGQGMAFRGARAVP